MAKQPSITGRDPGPGTGIPQNSQNDLAPVVQALTQATQALVSTTNQLMQLAQGFASPAPSGLGGQPGAGGQASLGGAGPGSGIPPQSQINIWEEDPFSEAVPTPDPRNPSPLAINVPLNNNPRLQITVVEPGPAPGRFNPGTPNFRRCCRPVRHGRLQTLCA